LFSLRRGIFTRMRKLGLRRFHEQSLFRMRVVVVAGMEGGVRLPLGLYLHQGVRLSLQEPSSEDEDVCRAGLDLWSSNSCEIL
jgi:hypothetical protein